MLQYWTTESRVKLSSNTSSHKLQGEFLSDVCLNRWRRLAHQSPEERRGPVWAEMHLACQRSEQEVWVVLHWFPLRWVFALTFRRKVGNCLPPQKVVWMFGLYVMCMFGMMHAWLHVCKVFQWFSLPRQCKHWTNLSVIKNYLSTKSSVLWQCAGWLTNAWTFS